MNFLSLFALAASSSVAMADYLCPASLSRIDAKSIAYGYTIQGLIEEYYGSVPVNASFFAGLPTSNMTASNGMTLAENTVANVEGLGKQAMLGAEALMDMGKTLGLTPPPCSYSFPPVANGSAHLMNAFYLEATLCGAFIGLADYIQSPVLNSLSARLAAEHGIHAAAIRAMMQPIGFMKNSTMLTPAFTPDMIMQTGSEVGMLGGILGGCLSSFTPAAPCGGTISSGPLNSTLSGAVAGNASMTSGSMSSGSTTGTASPVPFTGSASSLAPNFVAATLVVFAMLMV